MAKYIIELPDYVNYVIGYQYENGEFLKQANFPVSWLTPHPEPDRKAIEDEVWEIARLIALKTNDGGLNPAELYSCFGNDNFQEVMKTHSYQEAKVKYDAWKKEKIRVGDEVWIMEEAQNGVVTSITDSGFLTIIDEDGDSRLRYDDDVVKTNRHFPEVEKLLKQMRR